MRVSTTDLRAFVATRLGIEEAALTDSTLLLEDLALDSLALIELAITIEERYDVALGDDDLFDSHTYAELAALVARHRAS